MHFRVEPRDVPIEMAARRLGKSEAEFDAVLPNLIARGFPSGPDTGNFDLVAIDTMVRCAARRSIRQRLDAGARCQDRCKGQNRGHAAGWLHDDHQAQALPGQARRSSLLGADEGNASPWDLSPRHAVLMGRRRGPLRKHGGGPLAGDTAGRSALPGNGPLLTDLRPSGPRNWQSIHPTR